MTDHEDHTVSIRAEQAVIGALLLDNDALDRVGDLEAAHFYRQDHRQIFEEIQRQIIAGQRADAMTVFDRIGDQVEDCLKYCATMRMSAVSAANILRHAEIIADKAGKRALVALGLEMQELGASHQSSASCVDLMASKLESLAQKKTSNEPMRLSDMLNAYTEVLQQRMDGTIKAISTGHAALDEMLDGGLERGTLTVIAGRPGMGKCLGKGTMVLMFDGTLRAVEDLIVGDRLMGDDSTPRTILSLARGQEQMYWIRQNKAIDYRVNESHILSLKSSRTENGRKNGDVLDIEVRDYLRKSNKFKNNYKGYKVAVEFPQVDLPVNPYFLGLWLGDGDANGARITNVDSEVSDWLDSYATSIGMKATSNNYSGRATCIAIGKGAKGGNEHYKLACLRNSLRDLGVLGNKHIPHIYLANSTENRLQLLAGLIDSDGHASNGTGYEITQTRKALAEQIKFLADSLGFKTSITKKATSLKSMNYVGTAYRVRIHGDVHRIPVRIERKRIAPMTRNTNWQVTGITIEVDCVDDFYGFEIDGNHLFLLADMTVTHNTAMGLGLARNVSHWGSALFESMEMARNQVNDRNVSALGKIPLKWLRKPNENPLHWNAMTAAFGKTQEMNLFIDDQTGLNMMEIRAKARAVKRRSGLDLVVVDQLSFITGGKSEKSYEAVGEHTRGLVALSKELDCAVVLLCQLNRECEKRPNKRPMAADLAVSGSIEQDAANIIFLYRDEVYNPDTRDKGICEVISVKQRQGEPGTVALNYIGSQTRFEDLQYPWRPQEAEEKPRKGGFR